VFCIDGDGSVIMHMGALAIIGQSAPKNFKHIVINNGTHDSVGGQPSAAGNDKFKLPQIALACGYNQVRSEHIGTI
jgi:phosphonopyruvate decarboxylase